jgi:hypothetical protein
MTRLTLSQPFLFSATFGTHTRICRNGQFELLTEKTMTYLNKFLVGADPEFLMVGENNVLRPFRADLELDAGTIGPDHGDYVAELRPTPCKGTYQLVKNVQKLLTCDKLTDYRTAKWLAGPVQTVEVPIDDEDGDLACGCCCYHHHQEHECTGNPDAGREGVETESHTQPMGGHIHLDIRANDPEWNTVVDALDVQYRVLEDLEVFPKEAVELRRGEGYGKYKEITCNSLEEGRYGKDDVDRGNYGDPAQYHMEFRTPPSWLFHPRVAMLSLTGAKLAASDPAGTLEFFKDKTASLNTLRNWYDRYTTKDTNAARVAEKILAGKRHLRFDLNTDLKEVWRELDF